MKKHIFLAFALVVGLVFAARAQDELSKPIPMDPSVRTGVLSNGMTYFIKKNGKPEKRCELRLALNAGSMLETDEQQGLAHFVEHMCFNGTKNFKKSALVDYLESAGVNVQPPSSPLADEARGFGQNRL
jgi:zinc protease